MKIVNRILILVVFLSFLACTVKSMAQIPNNPKLIIGSLNFGPEAKLVISPNKIESALYLANGIGRKYEFIGSEIRDSILTELKKEKPNFTPDEFVEKLGADRMYFFQIDILANMLRVHLNALNPKTNEKSEGIGYALIRYFQEKDNAALYDPALLLAMQRAIAVCEKDSLMYASDDDSVFYALPSPTLVISGIEYIDNSELKKWDLFTKQEVNSYFALESIFDTLKFRKDIVLYDFATRDSIYALFRLKIPENQRAANETELACLSNLEVDMVVSGIFKRTERGANLELKLLRIKDKKLSFIDKLSVDIEEDNKVLFKSKVQSLVAQLFDRAKWK